MEDGTEVPMDDGTEVPMDGGSEDDGIRRDADGLQLEPDCVSQIIGVEEDWGLVTECEQCKCVYSSFVYICLFFFLRATIIFPLCEYCILTHCLQFAICRRPDRLAVALPKSDLRGAAGSL